MYSTRLRDAVDGRLVLPRLLRAIRDQLRNRGLRGDPLAVVRRKADPHVEQLAANLYLDLPAELLQADRDLALRLCYAAAATSEPLRRSTPTSPRREAVA